MMNENNLEILKLGNAAQTDAVLRSENKDVDLESPDLRALIDSMITTMHSSFGVGLAAPQIGKNINLFVAKMSNKDEAFINPEIILTGEIIQSEEGCLSVPNKTYTVPRREKVIVRYYNANLKWNVRTFEYPYSVIIQHEYDHLQGKLICDYSPT